MNKFAIALGAAALVVFAAAGYFLFRSSPVKQSVASEFYGVAFAIRLPDPIVGVSVDVGGVYALTSKKRLYKYNLEGAKVFEIDVGFKNIDSGPQVLGDKVYISGDSGKVAAYSSSDGTFRWGFKAADKVAGGFVSGAAGEAIFASYDGSVYMLNPGTGEVLSKTEGEEAVNGMPAFHDGALYWGDCSGHIYCADAYEGKILWKVKAGSYIPSSPVLSSGTVIVADHSGELSAYETASGELKWKMEGAKASANSQMASCGDAVIFIDASGVLTSAAASDGKILKTVKLGDDTADISCDGGLALLGIGDGRVRMLRQDSLQPVYEYDVGAYVEKSSFFAGIAAIADSNNTLLVFTK